MVGVGNSGERLTIQRLEGDLIENLTFNKTQWRKRIHVDESRSNQELVIIHSWETGGPNPPTSKGIEQIGNIVLPPLKHLEQLRPGELDICIKDMLRKGYRWGGHLRREEGVRSREERRRNSQAFLEEEKENGTSSQAFPRNPQKLATFMGYLICKEILALVRRRGTERSKRFSHLQQGAMQLVTSGDRKMNKEKRNLSGIPAHRPGPERERRRAARAWTF
ncbi:hypothetical protein IEQ34_001575 [Dendrobium chrysotoxum]|uniref:Uncharacterized protein n=1 Tax=Dendrobium chrysotoxum TaxID=161865 RepID=A0AAV7HNN4_DENCH|nr:hypothetical protein IEQ34_001575 [Dendrobium chrysotoxum]